MVLEPRIRHAHAGDAGAGSFRPTLPNSHSPPPINISSSSTHFDGDGRNIVWKLRITQPWTEHGPDFANMGRFGWTGMIQIQQLLQC
eukprot:299194-Rhodomonas_salina.3